MTGALNAIGLHASKRRLVSHPKKSWVSGESGPLLLKTPRFRPGGRSVVLVTRSMLHEAVTVSERDVGGGKGLIVSQNIPKGAVVWWEVSRFQSQHQQKIEVDRDGRKKKKSPPPLNR